MLRYFTILASLGLSSLWAQSSPSVNDQLEEIRSLLPQQGSLLAPRAAQVEVSGDFLYWISNQDEIWMATTEKPPAFLSSANIFSKIKVVNQRFTFDPGFRIAGSYYWQQKDWQNQLSWTRYRTSSMISHTVSSNEWVMSSWGFASRVNLFTIDYIQQNWKLD